VHKVEGNTPFGKYANAAWLSGPAWAGLGRMGQNLRKIPFQIKIEFLNIPRLWKFTQGDLGGILT
jgi:hypothetical protein